MHDKFAPQTFQHVGGNGAPREYRQPKTELLPLTDVAKNYLTATRGLRSDVLAAYRISCNPVGEIAVPFYDHDDKLVLVKFRHPTGDKLVRTWVDAETKQQRTEHRKTDSEKGGKPVLLGSHLCQASEGPLIICFGDYDALSVSQSGFPNAVSLPFGDKGQQWIETQFDFLEQFAEIILFPDYDQHTSKKAEASAALKLDQIVRRLGKHRCKIVNNELRYNTKDANELLIQGGEEAIRQILENADWYPEPDLIYVADYLEEEMTEGVPTGIDQMDSQTGGFGKGHLIIIAGDNGSGKTTMALNFIAAFVRAEIPVFFWSGEQRVKKIRGLFERILAGSDFLETYMMPKTNFAVYYPIRQVQAAIRHWYRDYLLQYTNVYVTKEDFFAAAELGVRRHGCGFIVIDNLMAFTGGEGDGYFQSQGDFAQSCKRFAETWNVPVLLVCHNKKENEMLDKMPDKNSIEGSKKITNWADLVFQMWRVPETRRKDELDYTDAVMRLCKNRESGNLLDVRLLFDSTSQRFLPTASIENGGWKSYPDFGWKKLLGGYREDSN